MKSHDTIATRLAIILHKLNSSEKLDIDELVQEFNVTKRTIQRDLNDRLSFLPLKKENNLYYLEEYYLGKLNSEDIKSFAAICGVKELFPNLDNNFLMHILDSSVNKAYLIKGHNYEDLSFQTTQFKAIEKAILSQNIIYFLYNDKQRKIKPYKLVNIKAIWYLAGIENDTLKTFSFKKIQQLRVDNESFYIDSQIENLIKDEQTLWFSKKKIEVILKVKSSVSYYFKRRDILPYQKILTELDNGDLLVESKVSFEEEILKLVRYWIPNVYIITPDKLHQKLIDDLKGYLQN
jgi:predicted DNA-binding transcriptional regulator YafY